MKIALAGTLSVALFVASCIFQNDPLGPNRPPSIRSYTPDSTYFTLIAPDTCVFSIKAVDPDGDQILYRFRRGDSVLSASNSLTFHATVPGLYDLRAEAWDGSSRAYHEWHVTVVKKSNVPPKITWWQPDQSHVACAVGDTLEFHFHAQDDHPEQLRYSYLLNSTVIQSGSPNLIYRFMERGDFVLRGAVWDGLSGDTVSWNVSVTGYADTTKPAAITDLTGGPGDYDGSVRIEWTAPGDDGNVGKASSYIVRTSSFPIVTENDWEKAEGKVGEPVPSPAGTREHMEISNLPSASFVYVMMRAVDDFFNMSPLGNCCKVLVRGVDVSGATRNAATNETIEGIFVATGTLADTSSADGSYFLSNVPSYTTNVTAKDENVSGAPGRFYDVDMSITNISQSIHIDFLMIPVFGLVNTVDPQSYRGDFLAFFKSMTETSGDMGQSTVFRGWNHWPITVYNPPEVFGGVDLQAAASGALADWESSTGLDLFVETSQQAGADVIITYDTATVDRHHVRTVALNPDGTPARKELLIYFKDDEVPITTYSHMVFAHELGHVLGLFHSVDVGHLMVGLTMPEVQHPTLDESRLIQILYHMPYIFDYKSMIED